MPGILWRLPARYVGPYAETDAVRTLEPYELLTPIIEREGTLDAYRLEVDLLPMVQEMRRRGVRIDQDAAEQAYDFLTGKRDTALKELSDQHGAAVSMDEIQGRKWLEQTSTNTAFTIRAPRRVIHRSQPKNQDGWPNTSTGCRAGSRSRRNSITRERRLSGDISSTTS